MFCHMGGRRNWGSLGGGNLQEKYKTPYKRQERVKISGYLARARARARPALVKRGASGPCPKKCLKIFLHRARVHDMCIFSSISSFYFISILNMYSVVCIPFNFFYCEYPVPYLLLRQNLSFKFYVYFISRFNSDHLINQLFHAQG